MSDDGNFEQTSDSGVDVRPYQLAPFGLPKLQNFSNMFGSTNNPDRIDPPYHRDSGSTTHQGSERRVITVNRENLG